MEKLIRIMHICSQFNTGGIRTFVDSLINLNNINDAIHDLLILEGAPNSLNEIPCNIYALNYKRNNLFINIRNMIKIITPYRSIFIHSPHPVIVLPLFFYDKKNFIFQHGITISHGSLIKRFIKKIWISLLPFILRAKIICSTEFAFSKIKKLGIITSRKKIITIPFGIKINKNQQKIRSLVKKDTITIGMANVLVPDKRNDLVIKSLSSYRGKLKIDLKIAGSGPELDNLKKLSKSVNNEKVNINFLGNMEQMDCFYKQLDFFILPSRNESFGLVILEALSRWIPVAVFQDVGGCLPLIENGKNGFIIKNGLKGLCRFWMYLNNHPEIINIQSRYISKNKMQKYDISNTRNILDNLAKN
ncbi:MAG: glycosyltransferase family 4 protein [Promethearchaeota archaeon]